MRMKNRTGVRRTLMILLSLCMVISGMGLSVFASEEIKEVTLTVSPPDPFESEEAQADFEEAEVVTDLYLIAGASKNAQYDTYDLALLKPYDSLVIGEKMTNEDWNVVAQQAAGIARDQGTPIASAQEVGTKIAVGDSGDSLQPGLYLVIPHGKNLEEYWGETEEGEIISKAESTVYEYDFSPLLIHLPAKTDLNEDGEVKTSVEDGDWMADGKIVLKYTQIERFTGLTIYKTVSNFEGGQATFIFRVIAYNKKNEKVYENVATIQMEAEGTQSATLDRIPAGTRVVVTEEYSGGRYEIVGSDTQTIEKMSIDPEENTVSFENTKVNDIQGYGIENHFSNEGEWIWSSDEAPASTAA